MTNPVLLSVSGVIPDGLTEKIARGERPKADYIAMAEAFPADLIDYTKARCITGRWGKLLELVGGPNFVLAWACFLLRSQYRMIFTDGEQIGFPMAFFFKLFGRRKRPAHIMIGHILSTRKKMALLDGLHLQKYIDRFIVYSTWQKKFIENRWNLPPERVLFTPFMVDDQFFTPETNTSGSLKRFTQGGRPLICSVGLEYRDYPTLLAAVEGLDVTVVIAAASPWSKRGDTTEGRYIPANVVVERFSQYELRELYAASQFVVMPLYPVEFQAGVTAILEAMAMGKAVICTRTPGQTDIIIDGETGLYVEPGNPASLHSVIEFCLNNQGEVERMGRNGRRRVEQGMNLECYVEKLATKIAEFNCDR